MADSHPFAAAHQLVGNEESQKRFFQGRAETRGVLYSGGGGSWLPGEHITPRERVTPALAVKQSVNKRSWRREARSHLGVNPRVELDCPANAGVRANEGISLGIRPRWPLRAQKTLGTVSVQDRAASGRRAEQAH